MDAQITGLHHVTGITSSPQRNIDFYTQVLGLRLVKLTVNFDDPGTYHLYYGDELGRPGSILTFFGWPGAYRGRAGTGQATTVALSIPQGSSTWWKHRLAERQIAFEEVGERLGEEVIGLSDPDGMRIELVASSADLREPWAGGSVPVNHAIRGMHSLTLSEEGHERTAALLTQTMGLRLVKESNNRFRYACGLGVPGMLIDLLCVPAAPHGTMGAGTIHHLAWRTPDDDRQAQWRTRLAAQSFNVSPVMDRVYFHSIYYREPGGVLFEIATDIPGFTADEPADKLGKHLMLPPWIEPMRNRLLQILPPLNMPEGRGS